jgi:hypothetical protein
LRLSAAVSKNAISYEYFTALSRYNIACLETAKYDKEKAKGEAEKILQGIDEHLAMNNELSSLLDLRNRESEFLKDLEPKK